MFKQYLSLYELMIKNDFWENLWSSYEDVKSTPTEKKSEQEVDQDGPSYEEQLNDLHNEYEVSKKLVIQETSDAFKEFKKDIMIDNIPQYIKRTEESMDVPTTAPTTEPTKPPAPTEEPTIPPTVAPTTETMEWSTDEPIPTPFPTVPPTPQP